MEQGREFRNTYRGKQRRSVRYGLPRRKKSDLVLAAGLPEVLRNDPPLPCLRTSLTFSQLQKGPTPRR